MGTGFAKGAPSDYIVTISGQMFYAEVKSTQEKVSFKYSSFTKHQIIGMTRQAAAGGVYKVFIHHIPSDSWYVLDGPSILSDMKKGNKSIKFTSIPKLILT
jgi:penicillin-binding protein-related factor A (putative recombinase)